MNIRETIQTGRRARRQNGDARSNTPWSLKGIEESTRLRISLLANRLGTTNGAIIDLASKLLLEQLNIQDKENEEKGNTFSSTITEYLSILDDDDSQSNDQAVIELNKRLQGRKVQRDVLMGRLPAHDAPEASEKELEA